MELSKKLVQLRKKNGLTQMELAEELKVSRQAISRWEVGEAIPSTENLKILSELYEVPVDYLLDDSMAQPEKIETGERSQTKSTAEKKKWVIICVCILVVIITLVLIYQKNTHADGVETDMGAMIDEAWNDEETDQFSLTW